MFIDPFFLKTRFLEFAKYGFDLTWFVLGVIFLIKTTGAVATIATIAAYASVTVLVHIYQKALENTQSFDFSRLQEDDKEDR